MTIDTHIIEITNSHPNREEIDKSLLKELLLFVGPTVYNPQKTINLSDKIEIEEIRNNFIKKQLKQSEVIANQITENIGNYFKTNKIINRALYYYYILKEIRESKYKIPNIHPGEILLEEFLIPMKISAYKLSKETKIPQTRISAIIKGNRRITADTALRLSKYFGTSAKFWLGLQNDYDIEELEKYKLLELLKIDKTTGANNA